MAHAIILSKKVEDTDTNFQALLAAQIEITDCDIVDIKTSEKFVWINVNGVCALRIAKPGLVVVNGVLEHGEHEKN